MKQYYVALATVVMWPLKLPCGNAEHKSGPQPRGIIPEIFFGVMNLPYTYKLFGYVTFGTKATASEEMHFQALKVPLLFTIGKLLPSPKEKSFLIQLKIAASFSIAG